MYEALLAAYVEHAAATECAFATVITNPFWSDRQLCHRYLRPDFVLENACQVLDLDEALDDAGGVVQRSTNLQRNLRTAQSGKLRIDEEQSAANVEEWYEIHAVRHREIGAVPLPKGLFTGALEHVVPRDAGRFFFVRLADSGTMIGGGFYLYHGAVIDALMPSMQTDSIKLAPAYLLALHSMQWAQRRGLRYYNWQASPPDSGVHRFKRQWGSRDLGYAYLTRITGDAEPFLSSTIAVIADAYRWHYVLPFDRVGEGTQSVRAISDRKAAWNALEAAKR